MAFLRLVAGSSVLASVDAARVTVAKTNATVESSNSNWDQLRKDASGVAAPPHALSTQDFVLSDVDPSVSRVVSTKEAILSGIPVFRHEDADGSWNLRNQGPQPWLVFGKKGLTDQRLKELCGLFKVCGTMGHPDRGGVPFFEVHATERELEAVLPLAQGDLEFVDAAQIVELDPREDEAATHEVKARMSMSWGLDRINVPNKFAAGQGVHVYIVDTGVRITHEDFGGRASPGYDGTVEGGKACANDPTDKVCAHDSHGHGTHCAGIATGTNYGVATSALVYAVKAIADSGSSTPTSLPLCIDWLSTDAKKPAVASLNLGGSGRYEGVKVLVDKVVDSGITVVVPAGNSNSDACDFSPAFVSTAITVGSTTSADLRSGFSNYGSCVDIWAPGSSIVSCSQTRDDLYATYSGTSMACPHVSGAAALVLELNTAAQPTAVFTELVNRAENNSISDLREGDTNMLLWVGASGKGGKGGAGINGKIRQY